MLFDRRYNLMDNMLMKMEKYTNNLEAVVEDRTRQLMEEKAKIDHLLYNMMPAYDTIRYCYFNQVVFKGWQDTSLVYRT